MLDMMLIALILFIIGMLLIASGLVGIWFQRKRHNHPDEIDKKPNLKRQKGPKQNNTVLYQMQKDTELKKKILEEIDKKSS